MAGLLRMMHSQDSGITSKYNQATFLAMGLFIENVQYQKSHVIVLSIAYGRENVCLLEGTRGDCRRMMAEL